ncbi:MAG TPA: type II secretion system F family protein [Rhodocyclaceae bacterium]|nr:MAG: secretion system protein [Betaproteobacteria bacterium CG2_30_68_42]PIX76153.1 MAG: type II secretion system F family protein [Rhodocyclales bacterium CG_4_10_14_3_um_filter_68_10]PJA57187.1 MAG: type II secretion system F family protein [Rhodocyclales bacterium CG_4_9_14_3_um_filter_68_10]HCX33570.1 type II secretion system F family protein [Rhodocyclaceae bacterium]
MAAYRYRAMNPRGRVVSGQIEAINLVDLEMRLRRMDLDFINGSPRSGRQWSPAGDVSRRERINFCFHLEQLLRAGVPILEGLGDLRDSITDPRFRAIVAGLIESIEGGRTLSQAMAAHPEAFGRVFVSLVRAGEDTGRLPEVLHNLSESLKWEDELASHTRKLVIYPAIVATIVLVVTGFMMIYLVPQMASFFQMTGNRLPAQTVLLIAVSRLFVGYWWALAGVPVAALLALRVLVRSRPSARYRFDALKLAVPVAGAILRKIVLARVAGVLAMMYSSGIPLIDAVRATSEVAGNSVIRTGLLRAGELMSEGQNVTAAFEATGLFPPLVLRMLRVGQSTAALDTALANVSYFYNRDVREAIEKLQAVVEPALTLVLGMLLLWVMLAVLGPIYDIIARLKF